MNRHDNPAYVPPAEDDAAKQEETDRFLHRDWRAQRVAWYVWIVLIIAALLGAFGKGPLTHATAGGRGGEGGRLTVHYSRIVRWQSVENVRLTMQCPPDRDSVEVWIERAYISAMNPEHIVPEPAGSRLDGDRIVYEFNATPGGWVDVEFNLRPEDRWLKTARVGLIGSDASAVEFTQLILP